MRVTTNTLTGPVQIALEGPGITTHSQSTWTKSSGRVSVTSKSQYSSSHTLYFKQSTSKTMCGNNAYPGSAGRIRGKG